MSDSARRRRGEREPRREGTESTYATELAEDLVEVTVIDAGRETRDVQVVAGVVALLLRPVKRAHSEVSQSTPQCSRAAGLLTFRDLLQHRDRPSYYPYHHPPYAPADRPS